MLLNVPKTKAMYVSSRYKVKHIMSNPLLLKIDNETIEFSTRLSEKLLGVHIDNTLSWTSQFEDTIKKCNSLLYLLSRIK